MMDIQGMDTKEIYEWQMRPAPTPGQELTGELAGGGWGYSVSEIRHLMSRARKQGASLLYASHRKALISQLRQWYDLKRKALAGGDFRVAFLCVREIGRIRNVEPGIKHSRRRTDGNGSSLKWREILPEKTEPAQISYEISESESMAGLS